MNSVFPAEGQVAPQYGSFTMENTGAYGGWVGCAADLVTILDSLVMEYKDFGHVLTSDLVKLMLQRPRYVGVPNFRAIDKGDIQMILFLIFHQKYMLRVLITITSMRRF